MKTKNLLTVLTLLFSLSLFAEHVPLEKARKVALNFYFEKYNQYEGVIDFAELKITNTFINKPGQETFYYVFSFFKGGFAIVPADDCLNPVLGYSFKHNFISENQPPNVRWWFQQFADQVTYVRENNRKPEKEVSEKWEHYLANDTDSFRELNRGDEVEPLLTTLWNQGWPYNYYCPETPAGGSGGHAWAGCVATAMCQIAYYWRWPDHGQGYTSYIPAIHPEYGVQSADFENTWYRYDEMVDDPKTVNNAIAEYMYHIAVNLHMGFTPSGSSPDSSFLLPGADSTYYHFKYFPYTWIYRDSMPDEQWKSILVSMLDEACPVYYSGFPINPPGHAFVCDGYQDEDYFHFNLGWGGQSNGYYTIDDVVGFNYNQAITSTLCPDTLQFTSPLYATGADTLRAFEGNITDGSGPIHNYQNKTQASWLIDPQNEMDSVTNITLYIKWCQIGNGDYLRIYDGDDNTAPMLAEVIGDTYPEELESTGNKVFVEFASDVENTAQGFHIDYYCEVPDFCSGQEKLTGPINRFDDGSSNFYYKNDALCMWILEPEGCDSSLTLYFDYFDTETDHDILQAYDYETQELLAEYSGHYDGTPEPVVSPSGKMLLIFMTNKSERRQGWSAYYGDFTRISGHSESIGFMLHPNPCRDELVLSFTTNQRENVVITIFSITGRKLLETDLGMFTPGKQQHKINSADLPKGTYFIRLEAGNKVVTKRVVKL